MKEDFTETESKILSQLPSTYTTVRERATAQFEEKRSIFIGHATHVTSEEEATAFIKEIKKEHRDATHNVFAYILGDGTVARYSDDGEPQGTAGMPALEALRKNGYTGPCNLEFSFPGQKGITPRLEQLVEVRRYMEKLLWNR